MPNPNPPPLLPTVLCALALATLGACSPTPTSGGDDASTATAAAPDAADVGVLDAAPDDAGPRGPTLDAPCADAAAIPDTPPGPARRQAYAAREALRACIVLRSQGDGGRRTPVYSGYRPDVRLTRDDATEPLRCALRFDEDGGVEPGSRAAASLACDRPVEIGSDAPGFVLIEGGREVGSGTVILPPG